MIAPKSICKIFDIPIYDAMLWLIVDKDAHQKRQNLDKTFGVQEDINWDALCSSDERGKFGLFFYPNSLTLEIINHEIFHLTHRLMEWRSCNFGPKCHEQGAILIEYLTKLVYNELNLQIVRKKNKRK